MFAETVGKYWFSKCYDADKVKCKINRERKTKLLPAGSEFVPHP